MKRSEVFVFLIAMIVFVLLGWKLWEIGGLDVLFTK